MGFFSEVDLVIQSIAAQYHEFFILEKKDICRRKMDLPPYIKPIYVKEFIVGYYNENSAKN